MIAINKHSAKPKIKCFEMPNAPYLERCGQSTLRDSQGVKNKDTPKIKRNFKNVYQSGKYRKSKQNSKNIA